jgi:cell wall-associated NlpC family hydrolase
MNLTPDQFTKPWVKLALEYQGRPSMKYAGPDVGNTPESFDCTGFVQYCLLQSGFKLSMPGKERQIRHSEEMFDFFGVAIHPEVRQEGDLVFFTKNGLKPTHVGIYLADNQMIHSPGGGGPKVGLKSIADYVEKSKFNKIDLNDGKSRLYVRNPIGYKRPTLFRAGERYQDINL